MSKKNFPSYSQLQVIIDAIVRKINNSLANELDIEQMNELLNRAIDSDGTAYPKYVIEYNVPTPGANIIYKESADDDGEIVYTDPTAVEPESGSNEVQSQNPEGGE